jgi:type IV pilus assembly protein PilO
MTYSEEFTQPQVEAAPTGPVVMGVTFTPVIIGGIIGFLGVAIAGYLFWSFVLPTMEGVGKLETELNDKKIQRDAQKNLPQKLKKAQQELATSKQQQKEVQKLLAVPESLETVLIDLNQAIKQQSKLLNFIPSLPVLPLPTDAVKLKKFNYNINFDGTFEQTVSTLRIVERLPILMEVNNLRVSLGGEAQKLLIDEKGKVIILGDNTLRNTLVLQALVPLTPEELAAMAPPPAAAPPAGGAAPPAGAPPAKK